VFASRLIGTNLGNFLESRFLLTVGIYARAESLTPV
jgi:hypothetical protein